MKIDFKKYLSLLNGIKKSIAVIVSEEKIIIHVERVYNAERKCFESVVSLKQNEELNETAVDSCLMNSIEELNK